MADRGFGVIFWFYITSAIVLIGLILSIESEPCRDVICECLVEQSTEFTIKLKGVRSNATE